MFLSTSETFSASDEKGFAGQVSFTDACYVSREKCDKRVSKTDGEQKENNRETVSRSCNPKLEILL